MSMSMSVLVSVSLIFSNEIEGNFPLTSLNKFAVVLEQNIDQEKGKDAEEKLLNTDNGHSKEFPYPKRIILILGTEFCERFNFYGMRSNCSSV